MKKTKNIRVLGIIPARGGSTSIPLKNIAPVDGNPLIYYTIREAKKAKLLDAFIVSTDSPKIADVARSYGADVPFLRPQKTAKKFSAEIEYQQHALRWLKKHRGWQPEIIVILRPTSPLRPAIVIDKVIKKIDSNKSHAMTITVSKPTAHPFRMWKVKKGKNGAKTLEAILASSFVKKDHYAKWGAIVPRQKLPEVYWYNSAVEAIRSKYILKGTSAIYKGPIGSVIISPEISVDIDEPEDLEIIGRLLQKKNDHKQ